MTTEENNINKDNSISIQRCSPSHTFYRGNLLFVSLFPSSTSEHPCHRLTGHGFLFLLVTLLKHKNKHNATRKSTIVSTPVKPCLLQIDWDIENNSSSQHQQENLWIHSSDAYLCLLVYILFTFMLCLVSPIDSCNKIYSFRDGNFLLLRVCCLLFILTRILSGE